MCVCMCACVSVCVLSMVTNGRAGMLYLFKTAALLFMIVFHGLFVLE